MPRTSGPPSAVPAPRKPRRKAAGRRKAPAGGAAHPQGAERRLRALLAAFATSASSTGRRIAALSGESARAARLAVNRAGSASRKAAQNAVREWKKLDTPRKIEFAVALLGAVAAATGAIARRRKR